MSYPFPSTNGCMILSYHER